MTTTTAPRYVVEPEPRGTYAVRDTATGKLTHSGYARSGAQKKARERNAEAVPAPRTCRNVPPGQTKACGAPHDGLELVGAIDCCPECRAACNAIVWGAVRALQDLAADGAATETAASAA